MDERIVRLLVHQKNIERYQSLLKTKLSEFQTHYFEARLSEERFAITLLGFITPPPREDDLPNTLQ
jgi:hypothetical protein